MKLIPINIIILLFFLYGCSSSSGNPPLEQEYSRIEKRADETDRLMSTFNSIDNTLDDGSEMTSYYHNGILKKIHIIRDRTGGISTRDCYFHEWRISYIVDSETDFDNPGKGTSRNEYYFKDDKLIGWKRPVDDLIHTSGSGYKEKEKELMEDVDAYLLMIQ